MAVVTLAEIANLTGGVLVGDGSRAVSGICSPREPRHGTICVVWDTKALALVPDCIPVLCEHGSIRGRDGVEMDSPRGALVKLLPLFERRTALLPGVHPSACLLESCVLGEDVHIGPGCVVSDGAVLGDRVVLQAGVFVGRGVLVGDDSRVEAGAVLQDFVEIGRRVILHSGTVIGCDGFGFVPDESGAWVKIPQIGTVIIEDDVEIGANSSIDRATFGVTRIRRGAKLGALVHIAHNCDLGEDCMMVGFSGLGGSVRIGRGSLVAGMVGVADHVEIGEGVTVAGRSGVTKNVKDGLTISGFPAQEHGAERRFQASLRRVPGLYERMVKLEKELEELRQKTTRTDDR